MIKIINNMVHPDGWYRINTVCALSETEKYCSLRYKFDGGTHYNTKRKASYNYNGLVYSGKELIELYQKNSDVFFDRDKHSIETRDFLKNK